MVEKQEELIKWTGGLNSVPCETSSPPPSTAPWLLFSHENQSEAQAFFSLTEGQAYLRSIPHMRRATCHGCSHGWMFMTTRSSAQCFLLNPVTMEKITLPSLPEYLQPLRMALLTAPPGDRRSTVMCIDDECSHSLTFCTLSEAANEGWQRIDYIIDEDDAIQDIMTCGESIYCITRAGDLVKIELGQEITMTVLEMPLVGRLQFGMARRERLVESCGDLYRIQEIYFKDSMRVHTFDVLVMNSDDMEWEVVITLEDQAFFLSDVGPCASYSTLESNVQENSIYFVHSQEQVVYRFDMADKSISKEFFLDEASGPWKHMGWVKPVVP